MQELLEQNPSLKAQLAQRIQKVYRKALLLAAQESGLPKNRFPAECPYNAVQVLDEGFWPE